MRTKRANEKAGARLKVLRESMGLSLKEAASRLGFSNYQTLSNIEAGTREVKASELSLFGRTYFCSLTDLLGEKGTERSTLMWRKAPAKKAEVERQIFHLCEHYHLLEKLLNLDTKREVGCEAENKESIRTNADIDSLADETRNTLGLGRRPAFSLRRILEQDYGVKIIYRHLADVGSAASMVHGEFGPVMVINADEPPWRRNYDMGHELFHIVTSRAVTADDLTHGPFLEDLEKKAERYSSTLLLPDSEIRKSINNRLKAQERLDYSDLVDVAREFGVSTIALLYRLANLKLMDFDRAHELAKDENLQGIDRKARRGDWGSPPASERFRFLAVRCLRKGLISRGRFAEMMEIERSDIDVFIGDYGLMETEGSPVEILAS